MEDKILEECANWIAEQASDQLGGFIPAELLCVHSCDTMKTLVVD